MNYTCIKCWDRGKVSEKDYCRCTEGYVRKQLDIEKQNGNVKEALRKLGDRMDQEKNEPSPEKVSFKMGEQLIIHSHSPEYDGFKVKVICIKHQEEHGIVEVKLNGKNAEGRFLEAKLYFRTMYLKVDDTPSKELYTNLSKQDKKDLKDFYIDMAIITNDEKWFMELTNG